MMAVGAAIRLTSPDERRIIEHAAAFAKQRKEPCYVISVVPDAAYRYVDERQEAIVRYNVAQIAEFRAVPIVQEGDDVPKCLLAVARAFGIDTLFVQSGGSRRIGRSIAERLLLLEPPFDVVVIGSG